MPSAIGSFDRISDRLQRGAQNRFDNEKRHKEYNDNLKREALAAQAKFEAEQALETLKVAAADHLATEIAKLEASGKLRAKQGFAAVYRQVTWMLPAELKFTYSSVEVTVNALNKVFSGSDLLTKWEAEIKTVSDEMHQRDADRVVRKAAQEAEDRDYFERCVVMIHAMFKDQNPDVKSFFKLLPILRELIVAPRHRGLRGQELIVEAIRHQMPGYAQRWHELLERSLVRSAEREQAWREKKAADMKEKKRAPKVIDQKLPEKAPVSRDDKWAAEAQAAADYLQPAYDVEDERVDAIHAASEEEVAALAAEANEAAPLQEPAEVAEASEG